MTTKLLVFLAIGTVAMGIPIVIMAKEYEIDRWKAWVLTVILTAVGTAGTFLMYYIENRRYGGLSFYGAVFLVPILFRVVSRLMRIPYGIIMDFCAVGECIMLALMKVHCIIGKCCLGRVLLTLSDGALIRFPSRLAEMAVAIVLFVLLFRLGMQGKKRGELYGWYILLYGTTRFILNIFREAWVTKTMLLPIGNIWSLVAIAIGSAWLLVIEKRSENKSIVEKNE